MTSIIGILCEDAVVIGSDSSATSGNGQFQIMEQPTIKITDYENKFVLAGTGEVGLNQRFETIIQKYIIEKRKDDAVKLTCTLSARAIEDFKSTGIVIGQINYGCLLGFIVNETPRLCEFSGLTFQPEQKSAHQWFATMGSGQMITDPFLALLRNIFWAESRPSESDAIFAITWALDHVIEINPGGIKGPIKIKVLKCNNKMGCVKTLEEEDLFEHKQNIAECKQALRDIQEKHRTIGLNTSEIPTILS